MTSEDTSVSGSSKSMKDLLVVKVQKCIYWCVVKTETKCLLLLTE